MNISAYFKILAASLGQTGTFSFKLGSKFYTVSITANDHSLVLPKINVTTAFAIAGLLASKNFPVTIPSFRIGSSDFTVTVFAA